MPSDFGIEEIARRCITAISARCSVDDRTAALETLSDQLTLIQESDFSSSVAGAFRFAKEQRDRGRTVRLIGSGGASLVNYLLGLSDVDPVGSKNSAELEVVLSIAVAAGWSSTFQLLTYGGENAKRSAGGFHSTTIVGPPELRLAIAGSAVSLSDPAYLPESDRSA